MAISNGKAVYGLSATGTPARTQVSGASTIGQGQTATPFTTADIAYSFSVTSTGASDVATLTLTSGAVAQTTGTPTINDAGVDFEGETLATAVTGYAILVELNAPTGGTIAVASSDANNPSQTLIDGGLPLLTQLQISGTIAFTFAGTGDSFTVTVIAKSS